MYPGQSMFKTLIAQGTLEFGIDVPWAINVLNIFHPKPFILPPLAPIILFKAKTQHPRYSDLAIIKSKLILLVENERRTIINIRLF